MRGGLLQWMARGRWMRCAGEICFHFHCQVIPPSPVLFLGSSPLPVPFLSCSNLPLCPFHLEWGSSRIARIPAVSRSTVFPITRGFSSTLLALPGLLHCSFFLLLFSSCSPVSSSKNDVSSPARRIIQLTGIQGTPAFIGQDILRALPLPIQLARPFTGSAFRIR